MPDRLSLLLTRLRRQRDAARAERNRLRALLAGFFANAGRLRLAGDAPGTSRPLRSLVMHAFGLGSTSADALCRGSGLDPFREIRDSPDECEHAVPEGDHCPDCNAEYKRARAENGLDGGD